MKLAIDPEAMTLRDIEDMEAVSGRPIGEFLGRFQGKSSEQITLGDFDAKTIVAMVWVFGRKNEPGLTLDEARDTRLMDLGFETPPDGASGTERASSGSQNSRASTASRRRISGV